MFYLDLFRTLQEERVEYVVVGGLAINLHGVERATMDVDLVLAMDEGNLLRFLNAATRLKLKPSLPVPLEALCDAKQLDAWVREKHLIAFSLRPASPNVPTVDIIVRPVVPFEQMYRNRIEKDVGGVRLRLASIDDLISLKTGTGRSRTLPISKHSRSLVGWPAQEISVAKIDYEYETTEERVRAYLKVPEIERLRWLEELCVFTSMVRQAPATYPLTEKKRRDESGR
jgi:predicted nucleotidyltransferase